MAGVIGEGEGERGSPASSLPFPFPDYAGHAGYSRKETPIALDADVSGDLFHSPSLLFALTGNIVLSKMNSCSKDDVVCL